MNTKDKVGYCVREREPVRGRGVWLGSLVLRVGEGWNLRLNTCSYCVSDGREPGVMAWCSKRIPVPNLKVHRRGELKIHVAICHGLRVAS